MNMGVISQVLTFAVVLCTLGTTSGCSCSGSFEDNISDADFVALVRVKSDAIPTSKGNYYEISKKCVVKAPYGTNVERAYMTYRRSDPRARTSCDGTELEKNTVYLLIGNLHDTDNPDVDSVLYYGCEGFVAPWKTMHSDQKSLIKSLFLSENNDCFDSQ